MPAWHCPDLKNLQGTCEVSGREESIHLRCSTLSDCTEPGLTLGIGRTSRTIECPQTHGASMSGASVGDLVRQAVWNGHSAIGIGVGSRSGGSKVCRLPVMYVIAIAILGGVWLLREIVEDCLVGWGTRHEFGHGSRGDLLREEGRHEGALWGLSATPIMMVMMMECRRRGRGGGSRRCFD